MKSGIIFPVILQLLGIITILAEFIIPSAGILTVVAVGMFAGSLYLVYQSFSGMTLFIFICIDILMMPFLIWFGIKILAASPFTLKKTLAAGHDPATESNTILSNELMGSTGTTITRLAPAGKALIDNKRFDVVSNGNFIEKGIDIKVIEVHGNRIVVKQNI